MSNLPNSSVNMMVWFVSGFLIIFTLLCMAGNKTNDTKKVNQTPNSCNQICREKKLIISLFIHSSR